MTRTGPGPEGIPAPWHHFAEFVRRALHAAADQVEPQADGLEPIRAQIPAGSGRSAGPPARRRRRRPRSRGTRRNRP
jgi:hypothetical protein